MTCRFLSLTSEALWPELLQMLADRGNPDQSVEADVRAMLDAVRKDGDAAVLGYVRRFDCPAMQPPLRVSPEAPEQAAESLPSESLDCIRQAADNIRAFHEAQKDRSWFLTRDDGTILGQKISPVDRAGLYVPGGRGGDTPLISSLLMTAIPAQVAGVSEIAVVTPPRADGTLNPHILAAAHLLGIREIYRMGGAWAIGALAYGTESVSPVDVIAGPGNIWVTTAKRLVQGQVAIDMIAGPSEVLILADASANPAWIAADMLSQAEHDALASAICLTDDEALARAVLDELDRQSAALPRADIVRKSLADWSAVVLTPDMDAAVALANRVAPEHLEVLTADPWARPSSAPIRRSPSGTTSQDPTTSCPRSAPPAFPRPCPCRPSASAPASSRPAALSPPPAPTPWPDSPAWSGSKPTRVPWNAANNNVPQRSTCDTA